MHINVRFHKDFKFKILYLIPKEGNHYNNWFHEKLWFWINTLLKSRTSFWINIFLHVILNSCFLKRRLDYIWTISLLLDFTKNCDFITIPMLIWHQFGLKREFGYFFNFWISFHKCHKSNFHIKVSSFKNWLCKLRT